jgi:hypothetical protein
MTRFPPPAIHNLPGVTNPLEKKAIADKFWEHKRMSTWAMLHKSVRARFALNAAKQGAFSLPVPKEMEFIDGDRNGTEEKALHDAAFEDFCILVFKCTSVEHYVYDSCPTITTTYFKKAERWMVME